MAVSEPSSLHDALTVITALRSAGHVAYLAGGCVRDRLLGLEPKDYDVATDAPPPRVRELFGRTQAVGAAFGVILVGIGRSSIEVATFRADGPYADGRRPDSVRFTTAREDAQRRDFTINGLFFDPLAAHGRGEVIDYVAGQADLASKLLRAIGDPAKRFAEDHLRMLRAVRFAARFDLTIEDQTAAAILADAPKIRAIAGERIADELRRMLTVPTRSRAVELLIELNLADALVLPLSLREGEAGPVPAAKGDLTLHTPPSTSLCKVRGKNSLIPLLPIDRSLSFGLVLLATLIDLHFIATAGRHERVASLSPTETRKFVTFGKKHLKLSNDELGEMDGIANSLHALLVTRQPSVAMLKRFLARPYAASARQLLAALKAIGEAVDRINRLQSQLVAFDGTDVAPPPLLSGDMLIAAGKSPGRNFKQVLATVYDAQLEDRIDNAPQALAMGLRLLDAAI